MLDNFLEDEKEMWHDRNVVLQTDSKNTMDRTQAIRNFARKCKLERHSYIKSESHS